MPPDVEDTRMEIVLGRRMTRSRKAWLDRMTKISQQYKAQQRRERDTGEGEITYKDGIAALFNTGDALNLRNMQVPTKSRRQGIASKLIKMAQSRARKLKIPLQLSAVSRESSVPLKALVALYEKHGFVVRKRMKGQVDMEWLPKGVESTYEDEDAQLEAPSVKVFDIGDRVVVDFGNGDYYLGTVTKLASRGSRITVEYDDGDTEVVKKGDILGVTKDSRVLNHKHPHAISADKALNLVI